MAGRGFFGGVHPSYNKELAHGRAIEVMPVPEKLVVHFVQNLGAPPEPVVKKGDQVKKGQVIGYVGMTGNATGNHCHYEIRLGGVPINPYPYMSRVW